MPRTHYLACFLLLGAAMPALAQNTQANVVTPAPPPREGTVGPEQLRDFALPGTRRPATESAPEAEPASAAPAERPAATRQRPAPTADDAPRRSESVSLPPPAPTEAEPVSRPPSQQVTVGLPEPVPGPAPSAPADLVVTTPPLPDSSSAAASPATPAAPLSWWSWALAAMVAGIALALLLRRRSRGHDEPDEGLVPAPAAPLPEPPAPALAPSGRGPVVEQQPLPSGMVTTRLRAPAPPPPTPPSSEPAPLPAGGIVSTRLRPWIDLDLAVSEILVDDQHVVMRIAILLSNSGAAGARDVIVEALPLNAGETQGSDIAGFYERPMGSESGLPELPRGAATELTHEVRMLRSSIREYEAGGRRLFVPILAFNIGYRWGSGSGRGGAAFLVGHEKAGSDRLAPLVLRPGQSRLSGLGVKRLDEAVRR